jgi:hypothetical protein
MMIRVGVSFFNVLLVDEDFDAVLLREYDPDVGSGDGELSSWRLDNFHPIWQKQLLAFGQQLEFDRSCLDLGPDQPLKPYNWGDDTEWED